MHLSDGTYEEKYRALAAEEARIWDGITRNYTSNWTEIFREKEKRYADNIVIRETQSGDAFTYRQLDRASDAVADYIRAHVPDRRIGLLFQNSFHFLAALIGINKTGRMAILFNTNEPMPRLQEMARSSEVSVVFGNPIEGLRHCDIAHAIATPTQAAIHTADHPSTLEDPAFVIFTSGTSGPSKPALFSHRRMIGAGIAWSLRTFMTQEHNCYITLPLYHGNALAVAFSAVITAGATATVRPKFSVTHFFDEINRFGCTHMVYIGELWHYLLERHEGNPNQTLHTIFGNGLHRSLWIEATKRYNIQHVVEHFGATEMPASALTNWMDVPGYCGYIPPNHPDSDDIKLIDEAGNEVETDIPGEAIFRVPGNRYRGYLDPTLDAPKLLERDGLIWWRSGDLLRRNEEGFFTFVDRVGDSYRFKGENIASLDVEKVLLESGLVEEAVVYGITLPGVEGKIGMASILPKATPNGDHLGELLDYLKAHLAPYALPWFLRLQATPHSTTSTLKIQKKRLSEEGIKHFDESPHFMLHQGAYRPIDKTLFEKIMHQSITVGKL